MPSGVQLQASDWPVPQEASDWPVSPEASDWPCLRRPLIGPCLWRPPLIGPCLRRPLIGPCLRRPPLIGLCLMRPPLIGPCLVSRCVGADSVLRLKLLRRGQQPGGLREAGPRPGALPHPVPGQQQDPRAHRQTEVGLTHSGPDGRATGRGPCSTGSALLFR